jgi:hypothetical protein
LAGRSRGFDEIEQALVPLRSIERTLRFIGWQLVLITTASLVISFVLWFPL